MNQTIIDYCYIVFSLEIFKPGKKNIADERFEFFLKKHEKGKCLIELN